MSGELCSAPITIVSPDASMYSRQQLHQLVLLFDHPEQRAQRVERQVALDLTADQLVEQERRALHVQRVFLDALTEPVLREPQRLRGQRVVEHPLLPHPLDDRRADFVERQSRELRVDVVGRRRSASCRRSARRFPRSCG